MKLILHLLSLILYITATNSSLYTNFKNNVLDILKASRNGGTKNILRTGIDVEVLDGNQPDAKDPGEEVGDELAHDEKTIQYKKSERDKIKQYDEHIRNLNYVKKLDPNDIEPKQYLLDRDPNDRNQKRMRDDIKDAKKARNKAEILKKAKIHEETLNDAKEFYLPKAIGRMGKERYHMDPVLNVVRSRDYRRKDSSSSSSSSEEVKNWKDEWKEHWMMKKFEAINSSVPTGDFVNMVGARPWGVQCGDPNQHDMPWGTCMLSMECEAEYRIYRGDYYCGRTEFICCAMKAETYDMYLGFDVSFDDKSLSTESEEKKRDSSTDKKKGKRSKKNKKKRKEERMRRKKRIKKNIRKIVKEIRKILNKHYKNGTKERKRRTNLLKKFIKNLKKQYKKDRESIKELHEESALKIDVALQAKLNQIMKLNHDFMTNDTFRDIVINGTVTKEGARMLIEAYPELASYFTARRLSNKAAKDDYLEYDIEYGYLYIE